MENESKLVLSQEVFEKLSQLLRAADNETAEPLQGELDRAKVVECCLYEFHGQIYRPGQ